MLINQCIKCGAAITDNDLVIWKCQECGKKYKIKVSKIQEMQILKNRPENAGNPILRCRECGIEMDNGMKIYHLNVKSAAKLSGVT